MSTAVRLGTILLAVATIATLTLAVPPPLAAPVYAEAVVLCQDVPTTPGGTGTAANDTLTGDGNVDKRDVMHGLAGNDGLRGETGDDRLCGGPGNDTIHGGGGYDVCISGGGQDSFTQCEELH
jgi:Ca2+-binding RTX toxin-like protein